MTPGFCGAFGLGAWRFRNHEIWLSRRAFDAKRRFDESAFFWRDAAVSHQPPSTSSTQGRGRPGQQQQRCQQQHLPVLHETVPGFYSGYRSAAPPPARNTCAAETPASVLWPRSITSIFPQQHQLMGLQERAPTRPSLQVRPAARMQPPPSAGCQGWACQCAGPPRKPQRPWHPRCGQRTGPCLQG